jgi:hypothetical protein
VKGCEAFMAAEDQDQTFLFFHTIQRDFQALARLIARALDQLSVNGRDSATPISKASVQMTNEGRIGSITRRAKGQPAARDYRIFRLDAYGKIIGSEVFPAEDDAAAVVIARLMESSADRELWEAERLIARLPSTTTK